MQHFIVPYEHITYRHAPSERTEELHAQIHKKKDASEITLLFSNNNNKDACAQMMPCNKIIISDNKSQHETDGDVNITLVRRLDCV